MDNTNYDNEFRIADLLSTDPKNARSARDLAKISGIRQRDVTRMIEHERSCGAPICARNDGYFLAEKDDMIKSYLSCLMRRIKAIVKTYNALAKKANLPMFQL